MDLKVLAVILLANVILNIEAYSSGAPHFKCDSMELSRNAHGEAQTSNSPYRLTVREQIIKSGDNVQLDIEKMDQGTPDFKGFIVQGRDAKDPTKRVGSFIVSDNDVYVKRHDGCEKDSVTHKTPALKNNITVIWRSPVGLEEVQTVEFMLTVAQNRRIFWEKTTGSNKVDVQVNDDYTPTAEPESNTEPDPESQDSKHWIFEGCNRNKGCFGTPENCVDEGSCSIMTTYKHENGKLVMQLYGSGLPSGQYVSMGFSDDPKMGEDLVYSCSNGGSSINTHWNDGRSNGNIDGIDVKNVKVETKDGATVCEFTIPDKVTTNGKNFDVTSSKFHILLAKGQAAGQSLSYHGANRFPSGSKVDFLNTDAVGVAGESYLIQIHGVLMVVAWVFCATIGMTFARYYKETWRQVKPVGKDLWFRVHQLLMGFTVALTFAAFWVVVASAGFFQYSPEFIKKNPHPAIGASCVILALIQPLMAYFRPHPGTGKRWVFDWAHWFCGNAAFFLGVVAIFFAAELESAQLPKVVTGIMLAFVVVFVVINLALTVQRKLSSRNGVKDSFTVNDDGLRDLPGSSIRKMLIVFYVSFVFSVTIAICFFIFKKKVNSLEDGDGHSHAEPHAEPEGEPEG